MPVNQGFFEIINHFYYNNIDISNLKKSGRVYPIEENILQDAMRYFDQQCKKRDIKYSAMKDTRREGSPDYKPSYMVFFEGKDTDLIMQALQEAYKDYAEVQQRSKVEKQEEGQIQNDKRRNGKMNENSKKPEQRESVKAKLAFFRDRVTARDQERDGIEKHHQRTDIQR